MNIFVLSENPVEAAQMQCDQHIVKMTLETGQMLCTAYPEGVPPYKRTHYNHPCNVWVRESKGNFLWLCDHGNALAEEYTFRFGKIHKSASVISWCRQHLEQLQFAKTRQTPFAIAMEPRYQRDSAVASYRSFYLNSKKSFASWNKGREAPGWYHQALKY